MTQASQPENPGNAIFGIALADVLKRLAAVDITNFSGDEIPPGIKITPVGPAGDEVVRLTALRNLLREEHNELAVATQVLDDEDALEQARAKIKTMRAMYEMVDNWLRLEYYEKYPELIGKRAVVLDDKGNLCWSDLENVRRRRSMPDIVDVFVVGGMPFPFGGSSPFGGFGNGRSFGGGMPFGGSTLADLLDALRRRQGPFG